MEPNNYTLIYGQAALALITTGGFVIQFFIEKRKRHWKKIEAQELTLARRELAVKVAEDAKILADAVSMARAEMVRQVQHSSNGVKDTVSLSRQIIEGELKGNREVSINAITEANHINQKIVDLTRALLDKDRGVIGVASETAKDTREIKVIGEDTQERVKRVEEAVVHELKPN